MAPKRRFDVMLSGTFRDLVEHRDGVARSAGLASGRSRRRQR